MIKIEEYIGTEIARNKASAALFTRMVQLAYGTTESVMVGHHIGFQNGGDIQTENEIPSADTLIFDHCIMRQVFGDKALDVMMDCAGVSADKRDAVLRAHLDVRDSKALQATSPDVYAMERADDDGMPPARDDAAERSTEAVKVWQSRQPAIAVPYAIFSPSQPFIMGEG